MSRVLKSPNFPNLRLEERSLFYKKANISAYTPKEIEVQGPYKIRYARPGTKTSVRGRKEYGNSEISYNEFPAATQSPREGAIDA